MEKNNKEDGMVCSCPMCQGYMGHYGKHVAMRWILGLAILFIVFWVGLKLGEFKGYFEGDFGGYNGGFHHNMMYGTGYYSGGMMVPWTQAVPAPTTTTPKTTTPTK